MTKTATTTTERDHDAPRRVRRVVGGFYLTMAGINIGLVTAAPDLYGAFGRGSPFAFVRDGWQGIVMGLPAFWIGLLAVAEILVGVLLLGADRSAPTGWVLVVAFHLLLCLFGLMTLVWVVPFLALVTPFALRDSRRGAPAPT